jgi:hypothetical protein
MPKRATKYQAVPQAPISNMKISIPSSRDWSYMSLLQHRWAEPVAMTSSKSTAGPPRIRYKLDGQDREEKEFAP